MDYIKKSFEIVDSIISTIEIERIAGKVGKDLNAADYAARTIYKELERIL